MPDKSKSVYLTIPVQVRSKLKLAEDRLAEVTAQRAKDIKTIEQLEERIRKMGDETSKSMIQQAQDLGVKITKAETNAKQSQAACQQVCLPSTSVTCTYGCVFKYVHVCACMFQVASYAYVYVYILNMYPCVHNIYIHM
jgi:hypothetical protein